MERASSHGDRHASTTSSSTGPGGIGVAVARVLLEPEHRRPPRRGATASGRAAWPRSCPTRASSTRPGSTRTSSSASGSARPSAAILAMRDDAKNHYAATLAKLHGVRFTIAVVHEADLRRRCFERAGVDVVSQPEAGDRRGDRPLRPRPPHPAGGDARGRPLRGARRHRPGGRASSPTSPSATCR